jgi:hypothetical protein
MADVVEQGERRGLSRRDMIKASAVAGAAAWTAPVIVDSLSSPAAAASGNTGINCSKSILFFRKPGDTTIYIAGFQDNDCQTCDCFGNWSGPNLGGGACPHACFSCNGTTFRINVGNSNAGTTTACNGGTFTAGALLPAGQCNNWLSYGGGTVTAINGATILGAMGFGGNQLNGYCPNNTNAGNQVTNLGACNTAGGGNTPVTTSGTC